MVSHTSDKVTDVHRKLVVRTEFARQLSLHGRHGAALMMTVAAIAIAVGLSTPRLLQPSAETAIASCALAGLFALAGLRAQRNSHFLLGDLAVHKEPDAFPALLDALSRAKHVSACLSSALDRTRRLEQHVLAMLQWHLDRQDRLNGIRLSASQQERLHAALMHEHRDLVQDILRALPGSESDQPLRNSDMQTDSNWTGEHDTEMRRTAEKILATVD